MPPQPATELSQSSSPGNLDFANPAFSFVNRVRRLPGLSLFLSCSIAAIVIVTVAGAFGTATIAPARRLLFWTLLIGFNTFAWICWFALLVRTDRDWWRVTLLGLPVLNLPLPFEIGLALRTIGGPETNAWGWLWARAAIISAALLLVIAIGLRRDPPLAQAAAAPKGRLWRAGIAEPAAIVAEDHYCRIYRPDGTSELLHGRFADLIDEVAGADGAIVRRGCWIAATAVVEVGRSGRRWKLRLKHGPEVVVSSSAVQELRSRGWIR